MNILEGYQQISIHSPLEVIIMNKEFDCVEMKRKGAARLQKKIAGLSLEEELKFWHERTTALKKEQHSMRKKKKSVVKV